MPTIADVLSGRAQWAVVEADCGEVMPMLPPKSVDHVITDPPYEAEAHTLRRQVKRGGVMALEPLSFPHMTERQRLRIGAESVRSARGWLLFFCQAEGINPWRDAILSGGGKWRRAGIWVKPDAQPQFSGDRWAQGFEALAAGWAGDGRSHWNGGGRSSVFTFNKFIPGDGPNVHPTQKPLPLLMELVELFTDPGDLVLDPFCGSGSLGIACVRLGRRYLGIDNGKDSAGKPWAEWAREGIEAESRGISRGAARAGQLGLFA